MNFLYILGVKSKNIKIQSLLKSKKMRICVRSYTHVRGRSVTGWN